MVGTVGDHREVFAPTALIERTDHRPGAGLGVIRERIVSLGNPCDAGSRVDEEVIDAVLADHDVGTALLDGEFAVKLAEGTTQVHIPALVLAELELVAGLEGDVSGHMVGTVGPHVQVAVPIDVIGGQSADDGPVAVLGVFGIRAADHFRNHDLEGAEGDTALGIDKAVTAVVLGDFLHGGADRQLQGNRGAFGGAEGHQGLREVRLLEGQDTVLVGGREGLAHRLAVQGNQGERMVGSDLFIESLLENGGGIGSHDRLLILAVGVEHGSRRLRRIEHGQGFLDAGGGREGQDACQNGQYLLHRAYLLVP